jgi:hypothetical protein
MPRRPATVKAALSPDPSPPLKVEKTRKRMLPPAFGRKIWGLRHLGTLQEHCYALKRQPTEINQHSQSHEEGNKNCFKMGR